jgi:hypothetical protein
MLDANALMKQSIDAHNELGISTVIQFKHLSDGQIEPDIKCMRTEMEYIDERKKIRAKRAVFGQVKLLLGEPKIGDIVTADDEGGVEYVVMKFEWSLGYWYLHCDRSRHPTGARYSHRIDRGI